ncbi:MAG: tetratricopeptide repeat protein [Methanobacteriota archaeon]
MAREVPVGREDELRRLMGSLASAAKGSGCAVVVSGEPGIGKSVLAAEVAGRAREMGFAVTAGAASGESMEPFLVFSGALDALADGRLFELDERTGFSSVMALDTASGEVVARAGGVSPGPTAETFSGMLAAVQSFIGDSLRVGGGSLGRLEHGDTKILIEPSGGISIAAVLEGAEGPEMRAALKAAAERIAREPGDVQRALDSLADARFSVKRGLDGVKLENERIRIAGAVLDAVHAAAAEKPLLLVLEDLHWADESSLFALRYVARNLGGSKAMLLATARPSEGCGFARTLAAMRGEGSVAEVALAGLGPAGVRGLVDSFASPNDFPLAFAERLHRDCAGNPFFVSELLRQMLAEGALTRRDGRYTLARDGYAMPSSVGEVVNRRLESLDPDAMALAEYASCMGREFEEGAVLSAPSLENPRASLEKLRAAGIVAVEGGSGAFSHALFRAAVYESMAPRWRSAHHRSIGEHYERAYEGRLDEAAYELARHFSATAEHAKAYSYSAMAAEAAESSFAPEQALSLYAEALSRVGRVPEPRIGASGLRERMGDLRTLLGEYPAAIADYERAFEDGGGAAGRAALRRKSALVRSRQGDHAGAMAECHAGLELMGSAECGEKARLLGLRGWTEYIMGSADAALATIGEALGIAERTGDAEEVAMCHHRIGTIHGSRCEFSLATEELSLALSAREALGDLRGMAATEGNLGITFRDMGDLAGAAEHHGRSLDLFRKLGDRAGLANALNNLGVVARDRGDLRGAYERQDEAFRIRERIGDMRGIAMSHNNMGNILKDMGEFGRALEHHRRSLALRETTGDRGGAAASHFNIGDALMAAGRTGEALSELRESMALCRETGYDHLRVHVHYGLAEALEKTGDGAGALAEEEEGLALARKMGLGEETAKGEALAARLDSLRGRKAGAP